MAFRFRVLAFIFLDLISLKGQDSRENLSPEDFGGIAVYLASDASSWHTGDTITIDGGYLQS